MPEFIKKDCYNINDLVEIMKILRSENGCPWDREQDHKSIRKDFIEETYEVLEAIDKDDSTLLEEELGDVLLQVVFHSQIEDEKGIFSFDDVADGICKKLIIRHPHVFGDISVENSEEVLKNWDKIKKDTKNQETYTETLKSVPSLFPSLMRAQKLGKRASRAIEDFKGTDEVYKIINDKESLLNESLENKNVDSLKKELGDILFLYSNLTRKLGFDAEELLTESCESFIERFEEFENKGVCNEISLEDLFT